MGMINKLPSPLPRATLVKQSKVVVSPEKMKVPPKKWTIGRMRGDLEERLVSCLDNDYDSKRMHFDEEYPQDTTQEF